MRAMRILLVANTLPPDDISGVGEQVLQLAAGLEELGHEVHVIGRRGSGMGSRKLLFPLTVVPVVWRQLREFRPHVVQVHESDGALAALLVSVVRPLMAPSPRLSALLQVSYAEELRSVRPLRFEGRILGRPSSRERSFKYLKAPLQIALGSLTADMADVVFSPSRQTAREVERDYLTENVAALPNVMGGRRVTLERDPEIGDRTGFLLYVGRLRLRKAVEVLLEALVELGDEAPMVWVVGDGEHLERLERLRVAHGLESVVRFVGRRTPGQVRDLMRLAGALVVPSIYEGMPLVILEAMEAELPVIASRVSGIPEVVRDGETGWLVPAENPPALARAIREWLSDPVEARRRGRAGRDDLQRRYDATEVAASWLERCVENSGRGGPESGRRDGGPDDRSTTGENEA